MASRARRGRPGDRPDAVMHGFGGDPTAPGGYGRAHAATHPVGGRDVSQLAHLAFEEQGPVVVARLAGEIDLSNAGDLQQSMLDVVPNTAHGMVVDLSVVSYLDSSGIRMLGEIGERLRWREQRFAVVAPPHSRVRDVLTIAGADSVVPFEDSLDAALDRVRRSDA